MDNGVTDGLQFIWDSESSEKYGYLSRSDLSHPPHPDLNFLDLSNHASEQNSVSIDDSDQIRSVTGYWSNNYFEGFEFKDGTGAPIGSRFGSTTGH